MTPFLQHIFQEGQIIVEGFVAYSFDSLLAHPASHSIVFIILLDYCMKAIFLLIFPLILVQGP